MSKKKNAPHICVWYMASHRIGARVAGLSPIPRRTWEAVAPMATPHETHAMAVLDGKLYAVGGELDDDFLSSVERYDPAANTWEAVAPLATARAYPVAVLM